MVKLFLGHGASGSSESMKPYVRGLSELGVVAFTVPGAGKLPQPAGRAVDVFRSTVGELGELVHQVALGGHSYGGRVASMLAAAEAPRGLVLFSYPLHPPGRPDQLRTAHLDAITCPVLFLSGEADPFSKLPLLRDAVGLMEKAQLVTYPRVGHGIHRDQAAFADALGRVAEFLGRL